MKSRNIISFDDDIINAVVDKLDGKYSYNQVRLVLESSVGYLNHICLFGDHLMIRLPGICQLCVNEKELQGRFRYLTRKKKNKLRDRELAAVTRKLDKLKDLRSKGFKTYASPLFMDVRYYMKQFKNKGTEWVQDKMDVLFYGQKK